MTISKSYNVIVRTASNLSGNDAIVVIDYEAELSTSTHTPKERNADMPKSKPKQETITIDEGEFTIGDAKAIVKNDTMERIHKAVQEAEARKKETVSQADDQVGKLTGLLAEALEKRHEHASGIKRDGNRIVVPEFMTLTDAARAIMNWQEAMEEDTEKISSWKGHPSDLAVAFYKGLQQAFGQVVGESRIVMGFFGPRKIAAQTRKVAINFQEEITVPWGQLNVPGVPIKITTKMEQQGKKQTDHILLAQFAYAKKYEPLVERIEKCVSAELRDNSIFNQKAINSRFDFIDTSSSVVKRLVYSEQEERDLETHVFTPIRSTKQLSNLDMQIKRTVLLCGKFGTGKTLTALKAAQVCLENGWTFLNVMTGDKVDEAIEFAKRYEPCVVFFEDIDQVAPQHEREAVNNILNTIDGLLSKSSKVMTILTTNNTEDIEKAMLRPGRIDAVIEMGKVDAKSFKGMVEAYCGDSLVEEVDVDTLLPIAADYTPSFIAEACSRSILYAISRSQTDKPNVTNEDIKASLAGLRAQFELMNKPPSEKAAGVGSVIRGIVKKETEIGAGQVLDYLEEKFG